MISFLNNMIIVVLMSSIVIIAVLLTRKLFSRWLNLSIISILWIIVLARLVIPVTVDSPITLDNLFESQNTSESAVSSETISDTAAYETFDYTGEYYVANTTETSNNYDIFNESNDITITNNTEINNNEPVNSTTAIDNVKAIFSSSRFWAVVAIIWMFGAWIVFLVNALAIHDFNKKVNLCHDVNSKAILRSLTMGKTILNIRKPVKIYECEFIDTPVTCGLITNKILLPKDFAKSIDNNKLYMILLHELSHIKNHDIMKNYLWLFARIVYWFNPLVLFAYKRYLEDIEYISDNTVVNALDSKSPIEYTESLLDAVKLSNNYIKVPVALSFCKSKSALRKRVEIMLKPQKKSKLIGLVTIALCIVLVVACFTTACINKDDIDALNNIGDVQTESNDAETIIETEQPIDTPEPIAVPDDSEEKETNTEPTQISLKQNPVDANGAIQIAQSINLAQMPDENFKHIGTYKRHIFDVYNIQVETPESDFPISQYNIYSFNGEIQMLQTSAFLTKEVGEELPVEELEQIVIDFTDKIYPNTVLTITSCIKDDDTWKIDGVTYESRDYLVDGTLYDNEDGSIRTFKSKIRLDGLVRYVSAEYKGTDYMEFSQEVMDKINSYSSYPDAQMDIFQIDEYYGDYMMHFSYREKHESVSILQSDMSLVDYCDGDADTDAKNSLTDSKIDELVQQYADRYFPDNTNVVLTDRDTFGEDFVGEGTLTDSRGTMNFFIQLNGDGKLHKIGIRPNIDKTTIEKVEKAVALETAKETLIMDCRFIDESRLVNTKIEDYKDEYLEAYIFSFTYTSENPTIHDYSFNAEVGVDVHSGDTCRWHIEYIPDGLDLITEEEAIQKAREYIVAEYDVDPDKLEYREFMVMANSILEFQVNFDYPDGKSYGASVFADTGERDGVGWGR